MNRRFLVTAVLAAFGASATGCSGGQSATDGNAGTSQSSVEVKQERAPVTLTIYQHAAVITDDEYNRYIVEPVKKKFPHITLEFIRNQKGTSLNELIAANKFPDVILTSTDGVVTIQNVNMAEELGPLMKASKFDVSAFIPNMINVNERYAKKKGEYYAIPWAVNFPALYYNKDLFDKFGEPYPKDGMTWDDTIALGKRMSRVEGDTQYSPLYTGMSPLNHVTALSSLSLVNGETKKVQFNNDNWKQVFELFKNITDLPGNKKAFAQGRDVFLDKRTLAILPSFGGLTSLIVQSEKDTGNPMNWDWASFPTFKSKPGAIAASGPFLAMVSSLSNHKQDAFDVITAMTSAENQLTISKDGQKMSALGGEAIKKSFGTDNPSLKGKNVQAVFKVPSAPVVLKSEYDDLAFKSLKSKLEKVIEGSIDINTALREAEEEANLAIKREAGN